MPEEPEHIAIGPVRYHRDATLRAVKLGRRETPRDALWTIEEQDLVVVPMSETASFDDFGPVYRAALGGSLGIPTGRVFVRFEESIDSPARTAIVRSAGYVVDTEPSWAPQAAWVAAEKGGVAESLRRLPRLLADAGVASAEPEMLRPASKK